MTSREICPNLLFLREDNICGKDTKGDRCEMYEKFEECIFYTPNKEYTTKDDLDRFKGYAERGKVEN
jgi:hypothetical protein